MKVATSKISRAGDVLTESPTISFSHLASCFSGVESSDDDSNTAYGFPDYREERLYETGILLKEFLKC
jgi:hypothetical protein